MTSKCENIQHEVRRQMQIFIWVYGNCPVTLLAINTLENTEIGPVLSYICS